MDIVMYRFLYHAIQNTANQNARKLLHIRLYSTKPSHPSLQFNGITPNLSGHCIFYAMESVEENASDLRDIPWYTTRNRSITSMNSLKLLSANGMFTEFKYYKTVMCYLSPSGSHPHLTK